MQAIRAKYTDMLTWNSPLSVLADVIFGAIPAVVLILFSLAALVIAISFARGTPRDLERFGIYTLAVPGITSSLTLIYTTMTREAARFKLAVIASFMFGMICAVIMTKYMFAYYNPQNILIYLVPTLSMTGIAIRHIYLLTRGNA